MGDDLADAVGVPIDGEVKAPVVIDARLPSAFSFVKLLGAKRGMVKVADRIFAQAEARRTAPRRLPAKGGRSSQLS
jgi:hypothetical protein